MKKQILSTLLTISITISLGAGLSVTNDQQAQAFQTLNSSLSSSSPFTSSTYRHSENFQGMNVYHGIDVSYHNGTIDWNAVADSGVEYAFLRAGYRGYGNGSLQQDSKFTTYASGAIQAGIPIGVYYFTEATTEQEAIEEAKDCIRIIQENNINVTLPVALDYEYQYNVAGKLVSPKAGLSKAKATANCRAFCDTIAAAGYTPVIYANKSDLSTLIDGAALSESYGIWLANYTTTTTYSGTYQIWQYTSSGSVDGISGKTDCNFWYTNGDLSSFSPKTIGDLKNATIASIPSQSYSGKAVKPSLSVKVGSRTLTAGVDYSVTYTNNIKPGKATATITGKGRYTGTKSKTFKIKPAAVRSLKTKTTASKIKLEWKGSTAYTGYEIYRSTTYNGSYTKIKTLKGKSTSWTNKNLSKEREYHYKIRAYATVNGTTYYGPYTKISAGALSGTRAGLNKSGRTILKKPSAKSKKLVSVPYGATIRYLGKTVLKNKTKYYHVQYKKGGKLYDGYLTSKKGLTFRKALMTTAKVKLRSQAGTHAKALTNVPKNQPVIQLSKKKKNGVTWYKTYYLKGKHLYTGYISGDYLQ